MASADEQQLNEVVQATRRWVQEFAVGLNLCPFANKELQAGRVRFSVSQADSLEGLLHDLHEELLKLEQDDAIATTMLIHPDCLQDFDDYLDGLNLANGLLDSLGYNGVFQIAGFHPNYRFEGTAADAAENYTNRTPYPTLHILREADLEQAIDTYGDTGEIPERNITRLRTMGLAQINNLRQACLPS